MKDINEVCFIIQARLSSERVPRKMIKPFAGTSLVEIACRKIRECNQIPLNNFYFSAYENEIKEVVEKYGLNIFHRSKASAFSEGPMQEVMEYHDKLPFKYAVVISACCPMLSSTTIDSFVESYLASPHDGMFSVIEKKNYFWDENHDMITKWPKNADVLNTKLVGQTYEAAHCLYAGKLDTIKDGIWMAKPPFTRNKPALFVVPESETIDIDYQWQFDIAEVLYEKSR